MTIFRGPGGTGSATSDSDTTEFQEFLVQSQAARDAALAAQVAAELAETNAETAETNAETAETNAAASASTAQDWAIKTSGPVEGSEFSAKYNAQLAATSATAAEAALDAFEDRYLGAKASDPTVDNDGNPLITGTQYFNTVNNEIKVYNGASWQSASVVGGTVTNLTVTNPIVGSITGNAATVTNGVYTTGSYSNPAWLTSLGWSKITSTPTTIAGYGITNAYTKTEVDAADALKLNTANPIYTGTLTGGTGVVNLGSGQFYKDASGNVGIGTSSPGGYKLAVAGIMASVVGGKNLSLGQDGVNALIAADTQLLFYSNGANATIFHTNGIARARIDSDGQQSSVIPGGSVLYPEFKCRAWVNFNGTGTVAIRASGNVSSITDNGTGDYTVNFTTAMPDANYSASIGVSTSSGSSGFANYNSTAAGVETAPTTTAIRFYAALRGTGAQYDPTYCYVAIFR